MGLFNFAKTKSLAGPGYIILNIIRAMNIITLLAVCAASMVMLVKTFIVSKFFFFDAVTHVVEAWIGIFLIITETPLLKSYIARSWPLFSPSSGFLALGLTMIGLGNGVLGFLNKPSTSQKSLGMAFWRIVISAGILAFVMGVVNIFANYIFRDRANDITARQVRSYGAVASHKKASPSLVEDGLAIIHRPGPLTRKGSLPSYYSSNTDGTPRSPAAAAAAGSNASSGTAREMRQTPPARLPFTISKPIPMQSSGEAKAALAAMNAGNELQEPNLAHHPAMYSDRI